MATVAEWFVGGFAAATECKLCFISRDWDLIAFVIDDNHISFDDIWPIFTAADSKWLRHHVLQVYLTVFQPGEVMTCFFSPVLMMISASVLGLLLMSANPFSGPRTETAVARLSVSMPRGATTVTLN